MRTFFWLLLLTTLLVCPRFGSAGESGTAENQEAAYTRAITARADKIVATLGISDSTKATQVRDIITRQYRDLSKLHEARDAGIKAAKQQAGTDKTLVAAAIRAEQEAVKPALDKLHGEFLGRLSAVLTDEQVDQVKDGLTYGVVPLTYGVYLKMYPALTDAQKRQIMGWLVEAREIAMDGSTSDEKHAVFGNYKGRINNFLSQAGYDAKQGERNLRSGNSLSPKPKIN